MHILEITYIWEWYAHIEYFSDFMPLVYIYEKQLLILCFPEAWIYVARQVPFTLMQHYAMHCNLKWPATQVVKLKNVASALQSSLQVATTVNSVFKEQRIW